MDLEQIHLRSRITLEQEVGYAFLVVSPSTAAVINNIEDGRNAMIPPYIAKVLDQQIDSGYVPFKAASTIFKATRCHSYYKGYPLVVSEDVVELPASVIPNQVPRIDKTKSLRNVFTKYQTIR